MMFKVLLRVEGHVPMSDRLDAGRLERSTSAVGVRLGIGSFRLSCHKLVVLYYKLMEKKAFS